MERQTITFEQMPAVIFRLSQEVSELRQLITSQHRVTTTATEERPVNVAAAAETLGVKPQTVYQNISKIPHRKRHGKLFFYPSELALYLNAGEGVKCE